MAVEAPTTTVAQGAGAAVTRTGRLEFLDTARGLAALVVALQHTSEQVWPGVLAWSHTWFRPGEFGVLLFFICSGFIIPASLERRGSLSEFWIGRAFRLWPLYLFVLGLATAAYLLVPGLNLPGDERLGVLAINTTMLQVFTTQPLVIGASWTLGYELVFYLLVSGLFAVGWHRRSTSSAGLLLAGSLVVGTAVPAMLLSNASAKSLATALGLAALLVGAVWTATGVSDRSRLVATGFMAPAVLVVSNRPHDAYFAFLLLATMFVGTAMYRWTQGEVPGRTALGLYVGAMVVLVVVHRAHHIGYAEPVTGATPRWWTEAGTFLGAYLVFGGLLLLRRHRFPRPLVYLGTISYSVYLMHALVLIAVPRLDSALATFLMWNVLTLAAAAVTYAYVEKPSITVGRRAIEVHRRRGARRPADEPVGPVPAV